MNRAPSYTGGMYSRRDLLTAAGGPRQFITSGAGTSAIDSAEDDHGSSDLVPQNPLV